MLWEGGERKKEKGTCEGNDSAVVGDKMLYYMDAGKAGPTM